MEKVPYGYASELIMTARILYKMTIVFCYYICSLLGAAAFSFSSCFRMYACFNFSRRAVACSCLRTLSSEAFSLA